jgi:hypothetical protein
MGNPSSPTEKLGLPNFSVVALTDREMDPLADLAMRQSLGDHAVGRRSWQGDMRDLPVEDTAQVQNPSSATLTPSTFASRRR